MRVLSPPMFLLDPSEEFRPETVKAETNWDFRKYDALSSDPKHRMVYNTYKQMHTNMTVELVQKKTAKWTQFNRFKAPIMEALELLNSFVDESDPDISLPNMVHAFQTAERIRKVHPEKDWMHLTGLIHDLGKVMAIYGEPQWSTTGDTFVVGCSPPDSVVLRDSTFEGNPDLKNPKYNTKLGMYKENCGLDNVLMSWGHDEYMYRVLKHNGSTLPKEGLYMIRYHSFYPWHTGGDYDYLCSKEDRDMLPYIREFNKFDLYTKKEEIPDIEAIKPYYQSLVDKYCPGNYEF